jgi:queuine tRNA-ribosyltransferase
MGVGTPADIIGAVQRGIDMFDCVLPTRSGRTGQAFTRRGPLNIRNARHAEDPRPLDPDSDYPHVGGVSRAYLHHLFKAKEMLGPILLTLHNLHYYQELMEGIRGAIEAGQLDEFAAAFHEEQARGDFDPI